MAEAKKWSEVAASEEYQNLSADEKEDARKEYFDTVISSKVPEEDRAGAKDEFMELSAPGIYQQLKDLGKKYAPKAEGLNKLTVGGLLPNIKSDDPSPISQGVRSVELAGRAIANTGKNVATMIPDAATAAINQGIYYLKPKSLQEAASGKDDPNKYLQLPSDAVDQQLDKSLPHPETGTEKLATFVEEAVSGSKLNVPKGILPESVPKGAIPKGAAAGSVSSTPTQPAVAAKGAARAEREQKQNSIKALELVKKDVGNDGKTLKEAAEEVKAAQKRGTPLTLADSGINSTTRAEVVAQRPGKAQNIMDASRKESITSEKNRVSRETRNALKAQEDAGVYGQDLRSMRGRNATMNYEAVRQDNTPVTDPEIWSHLEDPLIHAEYVEAQAQHMTERRLDARAGRPSPPLADIYAPRPAAKNTEKVDPNWRRLPPKDTPASTNTDQDWIRTGQAPDVKSLDYLIRHMDKKVGQLYKKGEGDGGVATALKANMKQLQARLKEISPSYKKASEGYSLDSTLMEARDYGEKQFFKETPGAVARYVKSLGDDGKKALRVGVARNILDRINKTRMKLNAADKVLGGEDTEKSIRTLFDNDRDFDVFKKVLENESKIHNNTMVITRGSPTFRRGQAAEDFEKQGNKVSSTLGTAVKVVNQAIKGWAGSSVKTVLYMMQQPDWDHGKAEAVARILSSKNPENIIARIEMLSKQPTESLAKRAVSGAVKAVAKGAAASRPDKESDEDKKKFTLKLEGG